MFWVRGPAAAGHAVRDALDRARYANRQRVEHDCLEVARHWPTLTLKTDTFDYEDGRREQLAVLEGTVPIAFQGAEYHIPVRVWIRLTFPAEPPMVFVTPTSAMEIKKNHYNVDMNGRCYMQYLRYPHPYYLPTP